MNIEEARTLLQSTGGQQFYIPSIKRDLLFKHLTTGIQKVIGRTLLSGVDNYHADLSRLGLFDEMLLEGTREHKSSQLTVIDVIAFVAQIKATTNKTAERDIECPACSVGATLTIDLEKVIENCKKYEFKRLTIGLETADKKYEFLLRDIKWIDDLILKQSTNILRNELSETLLESSIFYAYNKVCLYIESIKINGDEVKSNSGESFHKWEVPDRIAFFDHLPQKITISDEEDSSLINVVKKEFDETIITSDIFSNAIAIKYESDHSKCDFDLGGAVSYDTFFSI